MQECLKSGHKKQSQFIREMLQKPTDPGSGTRQLIMYSTAHHTFRLG